MRRPGRSRRIARRGRRRRAPAQPLERTAARPRRPPAVPPARGSRDDEHARARRRGPRRPPRQTTIRAAEPRRAPHRPPARAVGSTSSSSSSRRPPRRRAARAIAAPSLLGDPRRRARRARAAQRGRAPAVAGAARPRPRRRASASAASRPGRASRAAAAARSAAVAAVERAPRRRDVPVLAARARPPRPRRRGALRRSPRRSAAGDRGGRRLAPRRARPPRAGSRPRRRPGARRAARSAPSSPAPRRARRSASAELRLELAVARRAAAAARPRALAASPPRRPRARPSSRARSRPTASSSRGQAAPRAAGAPQRGPRAVSWRRRALALRGRAAPRERRRRRGRASSALEQLAPSPRRRRPRARPSRAPAASLAAGRLVPARRGRRARIAPAELVGRPIARFACCSACCGQPARLRPELGEDVVHAGEIRLGLGELLLGPPPAALVAAHARDLLEQRPPLLRPERERLVDHALADEQEGVLGEVAGIEQVDEVLQPDPLAVQQVVVLAGAVQPPPELDDAVLDRQQPVAVVEGELDVGHADRGPALRAGPDDVLATCAMRSARPCSPSAQRRASARLLLPEPFGPTTALIPGPNSTCVRSANDLKPWSRTESRRAGARHGRSPRLAAPSRRSPRAVASARPRAVAAAEHLDRLRRGRRLGHPARRPTPIPSTSPPTDDLDPEDLVVVRPAGLEDAVRGPPAGRALGRLLEPALGALQQHDARRRVDLGRGRARSASRASPPSRRRGERAGERLEAPRPGWRAAAAAAAGLALAEREERRRGRSGAASPASPVALTIAARRADRTPSSSSGWRAYSASETARLTTASPRNSSRSLCPAASPGCSWSQEVWVSAWARRRRSRIGRPSCSARSVGPVHRARAGRPTRCCARRCIRRRRRRSGSAPRPRRRSRSRTPPRGS